MVDVSGFHGLYQQYPEEAADGYARAINELTEINNQFHDYAED